jgi:hypothetical protein
MLEQAADHSTWPAAITKTGEQFPKIHPKEAHIMATLSQLPESERDYVAFVIQGEDVFRITADNILHTCGNAGEFAFQGVAKLRAAAALEQLTAIHNERPDELRRMAREMAREGMALLARTSDGAQPATEKPRNLSLLSV